MGELEKILSNSKKEGNKATAMDIIKVVFEGIGKVTDFVRAWKGDRGIDANNTTWTPSDFDPSGAGGGYNPYPTQSNSIGDWASQNKEIVAIALVAIVYFVTKK